MLLSVQEGRKIQTSSLVQCWPSASNAPRRKVLLMSLSLWRMTSCLSFGNAHSLSPTARQNNLLAHQKPNMNSITDASDGKIPGAAFSHPKRLKIQGRTHFLLEDASNEMRPPPIR
ncbi:hypothetical protein CEXT_169321 [Caerostris extrusa]|uniref:Uncharacterized protein n=1 Tax=Caerostris extrusa TaxID=172846 RepID=A0AAV4TPQ9_CAEEX|nr:hypothetical protein CEXT_169321 [Caerostris extrusa]